MQVSLRLFGVPEAAATAVCTFPDMKASLQPLPLPNKLTELGKSVGGIQERFGWAEAADCRLHATCQHSLCLGTDLGILVCSLQSAVDTATLVMQSGIPVARIELMDELQVCVAVQSCVAIALQVV